MWPTCSHWPPYRFSMSVPSGIKVDCPQNNKPLTSPAMPSSFLSFLYNLIFIKTSIENSWISLTVYNKSNFSKEIFQKFRTLPGNISNLFNNLIFSKQWKPRNGIFLKSPFSRDSAWEKEKNPVARYLSHKFSLPIWSVGENALWGRIWKKFYVWHLSEISLE